MKLTHYLTFYHKIQISLLFFILLPLLTATMTSYFIIKDEVTKRIQASNNQVLKVISEDLKKSLEDVNAIANLITSDTSIHNRLMHVQGEKITSFEEYENMKSLTETISILETNLTHLKVRMFFVNSSDFIVFKSSYYDYDEIESHWRVLKEMIDVPSNLSMQWLGISKWSQTSDDYFMARSVRHAFTNEYLGVFILSIPHQYFENLFSTIESGQLMLVDSDGTKIASVAGKNFSSKDTYIETEQSIEKANWRLIYQYSNKEIVGNIANTFYVFLIMIGISISLFFIFSIFLAKNLHKPLDQLKRIAQKFSSGNFNIRFPVKGKDEIAVLGNAFNQMLDQIKALISNIEQEQEDKRMLELQALFSQIRPHFLINSLNSIKCNLVIAGDKVNSKKIDALMSLLRAYMKVHDPHTLKEECNLIEDYVEIMEMRNGMNIRFQAELSQELEAFEVPRLMLQPIVENSIIHGFANERDNAAIVIKAIKTNHEIRITVTDNGEGMSKQAIAQLQQSLLGDAVERNYSYKRVGLINVVQRIALAYGPQSSIHLSLNEEAGLTFSIHIPVFS